MKILYGFEWTNCPVKFFSRSNNLCRVLWTECSIGEHAAIFSAQARGLDRLGGIIGRFLVICRPLQFEAVKVTTHSSSKIVFCKFWGICLKPFLTYYIPLRTTVPLRRTIVVVNAAIVFRRLGFTFSFSSTTWFRVFNWRRRIFRAEKRSAQASAHPSVVGLRWAFLCVTVCLCRSERILTETEWNTRGASLSWLTINEWGWVSYEKLWRSRRVRQRRITPSEIFIILHMIRKPNSIIVLLFIQNNS